MKIVIPTIKSLEQIQSQINAIKATTNIEIFASCSAGSAAQNRNRCLSQLTIGEVVIMMDDDMEGFYNGWVDDLIKPVLENEHCMTTARLLKSDGSLNFMMCDMGNRLTSKDYVQITNDVPTACIAFKFDGTMFNESYIGSGLEDNQYCIDLKNKYDYKFFIANKCRLIHRNEMKNQHGDFLIHNRKEFERINGARKW